VINMLLMIRQLHSKSELTVFTSQQDNPINLKYLAPFYQRNITVIIDREEDQSAPQDALRTFASFAAADILITGWSGFSRAASFFNQNCIVHQTPRGRQYWEDAIVPHAIVVRWNQSSESLVLRNDPMGGRRAVEASLMSCLHSRVLSRRRKG
jgi:hypothetical protein